jgi:hypothetical protein
MRRFGWMLFFLLIIIPLISYAQIYKWIDEKGNVNFTDNYQNVPEKYRDKTTILNFPKRKSPPETKEEEPLIPAKKPSVKEEVEEMYGDHPLSWWKIKFSSLNKEIERLKNSIEFKKSFIKAYEKGKRLGAIYNKNQIKSYKNNKKLLIEEEKRYKELNIELDELRRKARFYGVPREVRGE